MDKPKRGLFIVTWRDTAFVAFGIFVGGMATLQSGPSPMSIEWTVASVAFGAILGALWFKFITWLYVYVHTFLGRWI